LITLGLEYWGELIFIEKKWHCLKYRQCDFSGFTMQPQPLLPSLPRNVSNAVLRKAICRRIESMNSLGPIRTPKEATCGAKTRSGSPCQKPPLQGKTRCRLHGGKSLSGKDHPNYKHGHCTKETRRLTADGNAYIKYLKTVLIELGLIEMTRK
jgi:hypothetical protein